MIEPTIFLGPPGTGKTTTLLDIVDQEMLNGVPPDRIGFMTFTKRGVEEAVNRAAKRFNLPQSKFRYFNTLHSAAFRHLGLNPNQVFVGKKIRQFGDTFGYDLHGGLSSDDGTYTNFWGDDLILFYENYARITRQPVEIIFSEYDYMIPDSERAWRCIKDFQRFKQENGLYDFTDMLQEFIRIDDPPRLEVLIIDEAQDLSELQWEMVFSLARYAKRIYIAGDDDQTIFTWAGASERFISMPGCVTILEQSHRVPITVHQLANRMIDKVVHRRSKTWKPRPETGSFSVLEDLTQLDSKVLYSSESTMLLSRTSKGLRRRFVPFCRVNGLLYRYFDSPSIKPAFAKAIDAWLRLHQGGRIPVADVVSVYDLLPSEGHGKKPGVGYGYKSRLKRMAEQDEPPELSLQELKHEYGLLIDGAWNEVFVQLEPRDVEYIQKVVENGTSILDKPRIHISTIHRVKGGQADTVILLSETAKAAEKFASTNQDEETRVFYTAVTRTFRDLIVVSPDSRYHFGGLFT
jgi:superfamily I DNA/RNA helicase